MRAEQRGNVSGSVLRILQPGSSRSSVLHGLAASELPLNNHVCSPTCLFGIIKTKKKRGGSSSSQRRDELQSRSSCCHSFTSCAKRDGVRARAFWNSSWPFDAFWDFVCFDIPTCSRLLSPTILVLIVPATFCRGSNKQTKTKNTFTLLAWRSFQVWDQFPFLICRT